MSSREIPPDFWKNSYEQAVNYITTKHLSEDEFLFVTKDGIQDHDISLCKLQERVFTKFGENPNCIIFIGETPVNFGEMKWIQ